MIEVKTQAQLDKAVKANPSGEIKIVKGSLSLCLEKADGLALIVAMGASLDLSVISGSSTVRAYGSSTVRASGSSTVTAYDSSTVTAWGYVFVQTWTANVSVKAEPTVIVAQRGPACTVAGPEPVVQPNPSTAADWCSYYGIPIVDGVATLFKGVKADYKSGRGGDYTPGTTPSVEVFKPEPECAEGALYFSPTPHHTHQFIEAERYVACPVRVDDIVVHPNGQYPEKVKAKGCCAPVYEVDIDGEPLASNREAAQ